VDFTTGAIAVDFDFEKVIPRRDFARSTVEMVYLDDRGVLGTRNRVADEESREYKDWSEVTSRPPSPPGVR
jgi:hypothetical protein